MGQRDEWAMAPEESGIDVHLGKRLRRRRRLLSLTLQQLAVASGVRFQQIQKYECAVNGMTAARLWRLSEALGVPPSYFYDGLSDARQTASGSEPDGELAARKETRDLIHAYFQLDEHPRRKLLALAMSMNGDNASTQSDLPTE